MLEFHAACYEGEDGWVIAEVLDYPGVRSQGRTLKSARAMIRDALRLMAACDIEAGKTLPRPRERARPRKAI
jgi:predicted RNase H-like HicB family nuclease